jgi:hypothetical protein
MKLNAMKQVWLEDQPAALAVSKVECLPAKCYEFELE